MFFNSIFINIIPEIGFANIYNLIKKLNSHGCIHIRFRCRQYYYVFLLNMYKTSSIYQYYWRLLVFFSRYLFCTKLYYLNAPNIYIFIYLFI